MPLRALQQLTPGVWTNPIVITLLAICGISLLVNLILVIIAMK